MYCGLCGGGGGGGGRRCLSWSVLHLLHRASASAAGAGVHHSQRRLSSSPIAPKVPLMGIPPPAGDDTCSSHSWTRAGIKQHGGGLAGAIGFGGGGVSSQRLRRRGLVTTALTFSSSSSSSSSSSLTDDDLSGIPVENIRNFSIVAHVDHGKSTLADRILEHVGAVEKSKDNKQILDRLQVERDRGITVKAQTASVIHFKDGQKYLLNLIDTPGHVDFASEVSRSLVACQGVLLLVDVTQGVQAQTVSNFYLAFAQDLAVVPVLNKVDVAGCRPDEVKAQMLDAFEIDPDDVLLVSAKTGVGVARLLDTVVERVPAPPQDTYGPREGALKLLLQDSWYDRFRGTVNLAQVIEGTLGRTDSLTSVQTGKSYPIKTISVLTPEEQPVKALYPGQVGVFTCNMRSTHELVVGDTFHRKNHPVPAFISVFKPKAMVYAGFFPRDAADLAKMQKALDKVALNDASVSVAADKSAAFGAGWRLGFLGILHMEVFSQRLEEEYGAEVIVTSPSVPYKIIIKDANATKLGKERLVTSPDQWLDKTFVESYLEPIVRGTVVCPPEHSSAVLSLCNSHRGVQKSSELLGNKLVKAEFLLPLNEIVSPGFFDQLKQLSSGYATFDYEDAGYAQANLLQVKVRLNGEEVPEFCHICHASRSKQYCKEIVSKLVETLPRQQYSVAVQAVIGKKIVSRGDVKALRKDVTAKCYGGDLTRKMKLLKQQAAGKKRMKDRAVGSGAITDISKAVFVNIFQKK